MNHVLARRALAELVGTAFLVAAVIGSAVAAARLSPHYFGLQLLENSIITAAAIVRSSWRFSPVAAFNSVVTVVERARGAISSREALARVAAQITDGFAGAVVANLMLSQPAIHARVTGRHLRHRPRRALASGRVRRRRLHPCRRHVATLIQSEAT